MIKLHFFIAIHCLILHRSTCWELCFGLWLLPVLAELVQTLQDTALG